MDSNVLDGLLSIKETYTSIIKLLDTIGNRVDESLNIKFENMCNALSNLYGMWYQVMKYNPNESDKLITNKYCPHCDEKLLISDLIDYSYLCEKCDENFYSFEVKNIKNEKTQEIKVI